MKDISILTAIENDDINTVKELIDSGLDVNRVYNRFFNETITALMLALFKHNLEIIKYLVSKGANPLIKTTKYDFFYYIHDFYNVTIYKNFNELKEYTLTYEFQKDIINRYPECYLSMKKNNVLNHDIKIEFDHLNVANELNLF